MKLFDETKMNIKELIKYSRVRSFFYCLILLYLVVVLRIAVESGGYILTVWLLSVVFTMSFLVKENYKRKKIEVCVFDN